MVLERRREELCFGPDEDGGIVGGLTENRPPSLGPTPPVEESPLCKQSCALYYSAVLILGMRLFLAQWV